LEGIIWHNLCVAMANKKRSLRVAAVRVSDDDLLCPEVGKWAEDKHGLVSFYAKLFSTGMKDKWHERVYIELYAGAGYGRIRDTSITIAGSPLQALTLPDPFDKYIFCEEDPEKLEALEIRVKRAAPSANVSYIPGDCNQSVDEILAAIPPHSKDHHVLSLCFVDPCDIGIKFKTLRALSSCRLVDFLVLLALYMDANRALPHYLNPKSVKVDEFLDSPTWRDRWAIAESEGMLFPRFLAEEFTNSMKTLGYIPPPFYKMKEVILPEKNYPLYRLALFSRNRVAYSLWDQVLKYSTDQMVLGDGSWQ